MKKNIVFAFLFLAYFSFSQNVNPDFNEEFIQDFLPAIEVTMEVDDYKPEFGLSFAHSFR